MAFLTSDRRASLTGALTGVGGGVVVFLIFWAAVGEPSRETAQAVVLFVPAVVVFALTLGVAGGRFLTHRFDPLKAAADTRYLQITQRALTNSVEQGLAFAGMGSAAILAGGAWITPMMVALALTFGVARLAFWLGYLRTTFGRAPGMAATMLINLVTVLIAALVILF